MPKISAVMALYNTPEEYLTKTVQSILNQTFTDFELIVIDDSLNDNRAFFDEFKDNRIKYFHYDVKNGPGRARNIGIEKSKGEYIAIVDSDDVYVPTRFELQNKFLDENSDISLVGGAFKYSNNGKIPPVIETNDDIRVFMLFNAPIANPIATFRKNVFVENNLIFPEEAKFGEDYELWINAMFANVKMVNLKDILMTYTRRPGQLTRAKSDFQTDSLKDIYKRILLRFGLEATREELDLHYNIYAQKFSNVTTEQVENWFTKIIEQNKKSQMFNETKLVELKNQKLNQIKNFKNRLLKIKIGEYNLCLSKKMKIYVEQRG